MSSTVLWILGFVTVPFWLGPIVIYITQRMPLGMELRSVEPADLRAYPAAYAKLEQATTELATEGYSEPTWFRARGGAVSTLGALLEHRAEGTLASVAVMYAENVPPQSMVFLESDWRDGFRVVTTNTGSASAFPDMPRRDGMTLPKVQDAAVLARVHRERVKRARPRYAPEQLTRGADPIAAEKARQRKNHEAQVRIGYFRRAGDYVRPTIRGACLMTWRLLPPWKNFQFRERDRREAALLSDLGFA